MGKLKDWWNNTWNWIKDSINAYTGYSESQHLNKADELAQQTQDFNESYSKDLMNQNQDQFQQSQELAQQNYQLQKETAENNFGLQQQAFNYQKELNDLQMQREDTAYQRQVADLKAAGLSPLMASNGANASPLSSGSAPQMDMSQVSAASGSMIQLANEYAQLRNMAANNYLSRKQQAVNQRIGAQMALSDLSRERRINAQNMAISTANLQMQYNRLKKENEWTDQQISYSKAEQSYNEKNGFRNANPYNDLRNLALTIADRFDLNVDKITNKLQDLSESTMTKLDNILNSGMASYKASLSDVGKELTKDIPNKKLEEMIIMGYSNPKLSDKEAESVAADLVPLLAENRKKTVAEMKAWILRDGLQEVLRISFGMKFEQ